MPPIRFIQVGVGNRGAQLLADLRGHADRFAPAAFVDIVPGYLEAAREPAGRATPGYADLGRALAAHPEAEAVIIATPARFHAAQVRQALAAGRHVWVEKPLTYDLAEARGLAALAGSARRAVVVGNQYQYHPLERRLQALVRTRRFGAPFLISYLHHRHRPEMRAFTGAYPALWEQGVHSLDSILAIVGDAEPVTVFAAGHRPAHSAYASDTVTDVFARFDSGVQAHLLVTFDSQRTDWSIRVECEGAALILAANGWDRESIEIVAGEKTVGRITTADPIEPGAFDGPVAADPFEAFHLQVTAGIEAPTSIRRNLRTIALIDAAVRSLGAGQPVAVAPVPPDPPAVHATPAGAANVLRDRP